MNERQTLLDGLARKLVSSRQNPLVFGGTQQRLPDGTIYNPRGIQLLRWPSGEYTRRQISYLVGRVSIRPGMYADRAISAYSKNDCVHIAQMADEAGWHIPIGQAPEILTESGALTIVVPWPDHLQNNDAPLTGLSGLSSIWRNGRFVVGPDTAGDLMTPSLVKSEHDVARHALIGGVTRSGKTWFMLSILYQILMANSLISESQQRALIVDLDGKGGDGVGYMRNFPGQIGPTIINDLDGVRAALGWVFNECRRRYRVMDEQGLTECPDPPIYVFFSEFTAFTSDRIGIEDDVTIYLLANLAQKALAANIILILDTQNPVGAAFGDSVIKRQMKMRFCFKTADQYDTGAIIPPGTALRPYQTLTLPGDCYAFIDSYYRRVLVSYVPQAELARLRDSAEPLMREWPEFDPNDLEGFDAPRDKGRPVEQFTAAQIAAALQVLRSESDKRKLLRAEIGRISNGRARDLLEMAQELDAELDARDYCRPSGK